MLERSVSRLSCQRCGLAIRLSTTALRLDRCPRCFAWSNEIVPTDQSRAGAEGESRERPGFGRMMITTERWDDAVVLALYGNLDMAAEMCVTKAVQRSQEPGPARMVIDLSGLQFIDWIGLQILIRARDEILANGNQLTMLRGPQSVHRLFELTGALALFAFED